jgi:hypothetical protein
MTVQVITACTNYKDDLAYKEMFTRQNNSRLSSEDGQSIPTAKSHTSRPPTPSQAQGQERKKTENNTN